MSLLEEWILNKVKLAFAGSVTLIILLSASNIWLFTTITSLQADKKTLTNQVNDSQTQLGQKDNQIQTLQNYVDNLSNQLNQKNSQLTTLQNQVENLSSQINVLNQNYLALNQSYTELQRQYEDLLFHYNLLNQPASNFTTYADLEIQFSLDHTTYYYQDPVSGNITINYLNGTAFEGKVYMRFYLYGVGSKVFIVDIEGFVRFNLSPPVFEYGPGTYKVTIDFLETLDGYFIIIPEANRPWLQVEAK